MTTKSERQEASRQECYEACNDSKCVRARKCMGLAGGSPAPRHRLADLRDWLMDRIDGSEETRGEDGLISGFIAEIDALEAQIGSLTRPKTIAEWVAANRYVEPTPASKTQVKRFAAQQAGTPRTDAAVVTMLRLDGDADVVVAAFFARQLERELIAARSATAAPGTEPRGCPTPGACSCPAVRVEEGTITDAARYRHVRGHPEMLLHLSNKDFDAAIDKARGSRMKGEKP